MRALVLTLAAACALGAAGCGDDDEGGSASTSTVTATQTQTQAAPATTATEPPSTVSGANRCPDIAITPNSGDGIFDITTENVTCEEAEALLRSSDGLRSWNCRVIAEAQGRRTTSCTQGNRHIVFATEA
jgi:hypothetical protein